MLDFLAESIESKSILEQNKKTLIILSINKDICKCISNIQAIIKLHAIDLDQDLVARLGFLAKILVSEQSDLPKKVKSNFAMSVVDLLRDR